MDSISSKITFSNTFTCESDCISYKQRKNVNAILNVTSKFTIKINDEVYFDQEEFPILEFYKYLNKWVSLYKTSGVVKEFHYYTIEYDEYEEGAILSLMPFSNKARVKSIWAEIDIYNVFDLDYIATEFVKLEETLRYSIEEFFDIKVKDFLNYIPYRESQ